MAFTTPIDYGFAQVIDNSGLVNAYAQQQLANQKAKQAREKEMADQLAKIKPDGIKEADIPEIETRFKNLQNLYHKATNSNSLKDKAEYDAGVRQMMYDIEKSKNAQNLVADRIKFYGEHSDDGDKELDPDYMTRVEALKNIPTFSKDYETASNDIHRLYSSKPTLDLKTKVFDPIIKESYVTSPEKETKVGDRMVSSKIKSASPEYIASNISSAMLSDKRVSTKIMETYYDGYTQTNQKHDIAEAKQRGFKNYDPNKFNDYVALQVLRTARPPEEIVGHEGSGKTTVNVNLGGQSNEFGNPVGSGGKDINTTIYDTKGKPMVATTTVEESYTYPQIKGRVAKSANIRSSTTGEPVKDAGDFNVNGGETVLGLGYRKGAKGTSGKDMSGLLISNDRKDNAIKMNGAEYGTFFRFKGVDKDGNEDDYYMPAKDVLANIASLVPNEKDADKVRATIQKLEALKVKKNQELKASYQKTESPTISKKAYVAPDGKSYSTASLKKLGYSDEMIKRAIKEGKLK